MSPTTWSIQRNINAVNSNIAEIDSSIRTYQNKQINLQNIKTRHERRISELQRSYNKMKNSDRLSSVKKTSRFEGEIANTLTRDVNSKFATISRALTRGTAINAAIDKQVNKVDTKITELEAKKHNQSIHLANLRRDLRNMNNRRNR